VAIGKSFDTLREREREREQDVGSMYEAVGCLDLAV
jgi:hypothetical protein